MLQTAVAEKAGNSLDICTIVEDVHSKGVASTMPADVLVDAGTLHHHFMSNGIGPDEVFQQRMILCKEILETIEGNLNPSQPL